MAACSGGDNESKYLFLGEYKIGKRIIDGGRCIRLKMAEDVGGRCRIKLKKTL